MTTRAVADGGSAGRPSGGRLGALAAVTPVTMYLAWNAIAGWGSSGGAFLLATLEITLGAVVAGWIVGGRVGRSIPGHILGLVAYGFVGAARPPAAQRRRLDSGDLQDGRISGLLEIVVAAVGYVVYSLLIGIYAVLFLLPFGAAWIVTFVLLRRALGR